MSTNGSEFPQQRVVQGSTDDPSQSGSVPGIVALTDGVLMVADENGVACFSFDRFGRLEPASLYIKAPKIATVKISYSGELRM